MEKPMHENWEAIAISRKLSFSRRLQETLIIILCFIGYAILSYFTADTPNEAKNSAIRALFFPILLYTFTCYRSLNKVFLSLFWGFALIYVIYPVLYSRGIITGADGIIYLFYFKNIISFVSPNILSQIANYVNIRELTLYCFAGIMVFELILTIFRIIFSRKQKLEVFLSENNIYLREKSKSIFFSFIWTLFWTIITPINIYNYRDMIKMLRYRKESKQESKKFDFARISQDTILKVKQKPTLHWFQMIICVALIIIGITSSLIIFLIIGIIWIIYTVRNYLKKYQDVTVHFPLSAVEGSWIMRNEATQLTFHRLDLDFAEKFQEYK